METIVLVWDLVFTQAWSRWSKIIFTCIWSQSDWFLRTQTHHSKSEPHRHRPRRCLTSLRRTPERMSTSLPGCSFGTWINGKQRVDNPRMTGVHFDAVIHLLDIDPKFQENITSTHSIPYPPRILQGNQWSHPKLKPSDWRNHSEMSHNMWMSEPWYQPTGLELPALLVWHHNMIFGGQS